MIIPCIIITISLYLEDNSWNIIGKWIGSNKLWSLLLLLAGIIEIWFLTIPVYQLVEPKIKTYGIAQALDMFPGYQVYLSFIIVFGMWAMTAIILHVIVPGLIQLNKFLSNL